MIVLGLNACYCVKLSPDESIKQGLFFPWNLFVADKLAVHFVYKHGFALEQCSTFELRGLPWYVWRFRTKISKLPMFIRSSSGASYRLRVWYAVVPMSSIAQENVTSWSSVKPVHNDIRGQLKFEIKCDVQKNFYSYMGFQVE
jgi:hypothetical protein